MATVYQNHARLDCWPRCLPGNDDNRRSADPDTDLQPRDHSFDGSQRHLHLFDRELPAEYRGHLTRGATFPGSSQVTTDGAGRASFTFLIPESGVCAQLSGELTVSASGGGVQASPPVVVTPVPLPPLSCGPAGAAPAQPRLTG